ncbi:hypothetical protein N9A80_02120 [Rhodopirellula sp.]|nr:hypothetical protein [Rubripirellula sp.]MDA7873577.1 hypothetical protein [Rhodopirellula sp.]MDA7907024.1 DNA-3-methyladenine glycosylase 2 family protein [bacterium]MDA7905120.1 hypothetical protein [Rhodopirellula sp.]MDB4477338.1 hypothetical protein [Rhodopirellula sp.]MDB4621341.1 hypothetical protein [Rubripirellula sp.]
MNQKLHRDFLTTSDKISGTLYHAISDCGPLPRHRGTTQPLVTTMCRTIAGQQLSVQAARTIWNRVLADSETQPLIDYLINASPTRLRACGLSRAKGRAMKGIADASNSGRLEPTDLKRLSHHARSQCLTEIWGVGQWTADMMGIFYFGDRDIWPESDITVTKTLQLLIGHRRKTILAAARFAPQRSSLARYMWKIADATPNTSQQRQKVV